MINDLVRQFKLIESTIYDMHSDRYNALIVLDIVQCLKLYLDDILILLKEYENKKFTCGNKEPFIIDNVRYKNSRLLFRVMYHNGLIGFKHNYPTNFILVE